MASEGSRRLEEALKLMAEAIQLKLAEMEPSSGVVSASVSAERTDTPGEISVDEVETASVAELKEKQREANFMKNLYPRWRIDKRVYESTIIFIISSFFGIGDVYLTGNIRSILRDLGLERYDALGGGTALHWAVRMEDLELVTCILEAGQVDVNAKDGMWEATALHWAARTGNLAIVEAMRANHLRTGKFMLRVRDKWKFTALECAILSGGKPNIAMVKELLRFKDSVHVYDDKNGVIADVEKILQEGGPHTEVTENSFESQREEWYGNHEALYGKLSWRTDTYLHWAVKMEDAALVTHILEAGKIDVNDDGENDCPPLICAVRFRNLDIVRLMVTKHIESSNFNVNCKDQFEGYTALHWAIVCGEHENIDMVKELLRCKATMRLTEECKYGKTPLQLAHERGFKDIQKVLMELEVVRRYVEDLYQDRQVYVDAANAILVGAALIASVTFASWLQPPLGYTPDYADVQQNKGLRAFWVFNCLSFYFAIATVVFGARSVLPRSPYFIKVTVEKLQKNLLITAFLLACSVFFVILAFGIAGCIVLTPIMEFQLYMIIPTIFGGLLCFISLGLLSYSMWEDSLGREHVARRRFEWSKYTERYFHS